MLTSSGINNKFKYVKSRTDSGIARRNTKSQGLKRNFGLKCIIITFFAVCTVIGVICLTLSFNSKMQAYETRTKILEDANRLLLKENGALLDEKNLQLNYVVYGISWDKLFTVLILGLILAFIVLLCVQQNYFTLQNNKLYSEKEKYIIQISESANTERTVALYKAGESVFGNFLSLFTGYSQFFGKLFDLYGKREEKSLKKD